MSVGRFELVLLLNKVTVLLKKKHCFEEGRDVYKKVTMIYSFVLSDKKVVSLKGHFVK
ncbi:hypothetical protein Y693_15320 [Bacillus anthracis str. 95014]|nr:hypothetical protein Y693_15320 [Bacillus anthracis str. 95014]